MTTEWLDETIMKGPQLTLVTTEEAYLEVCEELNVPMKDRGDWLFGGRACTHWFPNICACVITVEPRNEDDQIEVVGTIVHEATHVWQFYCENIGECKPSREFMAYSIQAIAVKLMRAYRTQTLTQVIEEK